MKELAPEDIRSQIIHLPGRPPAMLDSAIAGFYGTGTKQVNQAVKRNPRKFPPDFCFQLTDEEVKILHSDYGIAISSRSRVNPHGFTRPGFRTLAFLLNGTISDNIILNAVKEIWRTETVLLHIEKASVYVIEKVSGLVKIGYSADVKKRIANIRSQGGFEINRMFHSDPVPNFKQIESDLHKNFNNDRVIGEWFRADFDEVCQLIRNIEPCEEPQAGDELLHKVNMGLALWKYDWEANNMTVTIMENDIAAERCVRIIRAFSETEAVRHYQADSESSDQIAGKPV